MSARSRRHFLQVVAGAGASMFASTACSGNSGAPENVGDVAAGTVSSLSVGTLQAIGTKPACIGRDAQGIYAMTLTCTHEGCNMASEGSVSASGIACACHGSRFDPSGKVTNGPADSALAHFAVTADASGNLTVHTGQIVAASTRLAV